MSLFSAVQLAPRDPILGLNEAFNADARPTKVNLGVGVYTNEEGKIPLLRAVREAEKVRVEAGLPRGYLPIDGIAAYDAAVQKLLLGNDSPLIAAGRVVTAQALGGTGALKIGADFLRTVNPNVKVAISDPSWENHRALFEAAGFEVVAYPYYDAATNGVNFEGMLSALNGYAAGTVVVLHACCHNPTGVDLTEAQWQQVVDVVKARNLVPFLDMAYQGFGENIEADAAAVRLFAAADLNAFVSSSFSKSFSLYGERVGALSIITSSKEEATRVLSQLKRVIRTNYSNPPTHGGAVVAAVLASPELHASWVQELGEMRDRIRAMRNGLVERLKASGVDRDFSFINEQRGMFSYSGLTSAQVDRLRDEFGIYAVGTGRICVAALNTRNLDAVANAVAAVLK
ncbi:MULTISPECIES: amino acid aminotransferase [Burkholderia]|uniref:Aminotransferase n=2 Tax=Burkholderia cepacia complex TaxID=87882 RepID=A0A6P2SMD5_9BURK|nr:MULTISPECIES: amino acid aminotransferase [Burkholderia]KER67410.1 aromatic amino acid aminotransferase [Burkholderia cepacia]MBN3781017.1 aspartate/tyrosine/aromatic aminotransferase [Burkholderia sp. Ac-20345]MBN3843560.1 aspartate/tyrosine/aromatic aminotransferase [Burkholderia sp. Ac-20349]MCA8299716.1 aspartate/tyrosine/aromatic aminotransferase [Burkholderia sp. AU30198]MDN7521245.1 amino acid aminotransferase [Burkholderia sp. AU45251]